MDGFFYFFQIHTIDLKIYLSQVIKWGCCRSLQMSPCLSLAVGPGNEVKGLLFCRKFEE